MSWLKGKAHPGWASPIRVQSHFLLRSSSLVCSSGGALLSHLGTSNRSWHGVFLDLPALAQHSKHNSPISLREHGLTLPWKPKSLENLTVQGGQQLSCFLTDHPAGCLSPLLRTSSSISPKKGVWEGKEKLCLSAFSIMFPTHSLLIT